jgi:hypothetical protein
VVLAWSLGLGLAAPLGVASILFAPNPPGGAFPLFGILLTGRPAAALILLTSAACAWLAWSTYRLEPAGWWGSLALVVIGGASATLTCAFVDLAGYYVAWGSRPEDVAYLGGSAFFGRESVAGQSAIFTLLGVVYLSVVRRHFLNPR